ANWSIRCRRSNRERHNCPKAQALGPVYTVTCSRPINRPIGEPTGKSRRTGDFAAALSGTIRKRRTSLMNRWCAWPGIGAVILAVGCSSRSENRPIAVTATQEVNKVTAESHEHKQSEVQEKEVDWKAISKEE